MAWTLTDDISHYLAAAGDFLRSSPVRHTIQLSAAETLLARGGSAFGDIAPLFGWWRPAAGAEAGAVQSAFLHTPPYPALLTRLPADSVQPLAEALVARRRQLPGVNAEQGDAKAFAAAWAALTGATAGLFRTSRLFRLGELAPPWPLPRGAARVAAAADRDLLESWLAAFTEEVGDMGGRIPGTVEDRLSYGGLTLWEIDGTAVSLAGVTRAAAGVVRIGPVYTPPDQRQRGYAGAVTVAVSHAVREAGVREVVLFTDLANATSNALYQRLGYRPVEDRVVLRFAASAQPADRVRTARRTT
jgi:RimJ/RimL family protein N-acetyltransferase